MPQRLSLLSMALTGAEIRITAPCFQQSNPNARACVMANLQPSVSVSPSIAASPSPIGSGGGGASVTQEGNRRNMASVEQLVLDLCDPVLRENALVELSKKREMFRDMLAPLLWHSFGTIAVLLQEIIYIYPALSPPATLSSGASNRVCNVLALFQCVASHPETRILFLDAQIPYFLYPFLYIQSKTKPFEYLRLTSLGVIGALVKVDDSEVISFLLKTQILPCCLRSMEMGSELSKTVATFILQKILLDKLGLIYICSIPERLHAVGSILAYMVVSRPDQSAASARLLKHIIRCFDRLSDNPSACAALQTHLLDVLKDGTVDSCLADDPATRGCLQQLMHKVCRSSGRSFSDRPRLHE
uniref:Uncharacterized protein n=1 Tax=Avena sativa TaxID=4498 RepID=A0ACD5X587_AVESA